MHFEILVEDQSGKKSLDILVPKIIGNEHTFKIHSYKGIGRIPKKLKPNENANKRILLDQIPRVLQGYGKAFADYDASVIIVCDLDDRCLKDFKRELIDILDSCSPKPVAKFCFAIEDGEAWFLGDVSAIKKSLP